MKTQKGLFLQKVSMMNHIIITGASRGIGAAIADRFLVQGNTLHCVSRTMNEDLVERASSQHIPLYYDEADLSLHGLADEYIGDVFSRIDLSKTQRIALINNAGMLEPIAPLGLTRPDIMEKHLALNLLAPALLMTGFIKNTTEYNFPKVILNISSGAATIPYVGWSMYCTSKAGLTMLSRTAGLEQSLAVNPVRIFALAPGIVDTSMQTLIRNTNPAYFAEKEFFVKLHSDGKLTDPDQVAGVIAGSLFNPAIPQGGMITIDQLKEFVTTG